MAYGEPLTALAVTGITALVGVVAGTVATEVDANKANKERAKAEKARKKAEKEAAIQQTQAETSAYKASTLDTEIAIREDLHRQKVAQSDAKTQYTDEYRAKLGLTGDAYDQILSNLYAQERQIAIETQNTLIAKEQAEIDAIEEAQGGNFGQIALYSILGIASVGTLVYLKKRKQ